MAANRAEKTGHCLCGSVQYRVAGEIQPVFHCHCENCRRLTGNFVAASRVHTDALMIKDSNGDLGWHDLEYARYGFCRGCGSTLFYQSADHRERTSVMVGTLDDAADLSLTQVWFAAQAQRDTEGTAAAEQFEGNG